MNNRQPAIRRALRDFDLRRLFIEELGWDHDTRRIDILIDAGQFTLEGVAQKRGLAVLLCSPVDGLPDYNTRQRIEREVAKQVREHLIIFAEQQAQVWQWVRREPGQPLRFREFRSEAGQVNEALVQRLDGMAFDFAEEEGLTILDASSRVRAAFDVERVTKRFYDLFKGQHDAFLKFLQGIPDAEMQRWYVSVMLNRLMFIYFIQKKGFLNGDVDYLRNRLTQMQQDRGRDHFYRDFLCPLFFEGFASRARSAETLRLLGEVPYLNGGLFLRHQIEELHGEQIDIPDAAFERIFAFFDNYRWHLDERPLREQNEINPDVLGYIFEKYINQKQMGAYYTKEDITGYISRNTIIPYLFDAAKPECRIAFEGEHSLWDLLREDPDRYIYPAVRHGAEYDLPPEIAAGIEDVSQRGGWNVAAPAEYALPTEIWREVVARRQRYAEVRAKLANGEVREINDLITLNLDIEQFALDVIIRAEGPELLRAFWKAIQRVTVLDPTCGSGAFLFAALNILEPLYDACLERMAAFVDEQDRPPIPDPSPTRGEGNENWDVSPELHRAMTEIARGLRREQTYSEEILWQALRDKQLDGRKFRRQQPVGAFVLDFYCSSERLAVEVDGAIHDSQREADAERQALIESLGIRFVRVAAEDVEQNLPHVLATIRAAFLPSPRAAVGEGPGVRGRKFSDFRETLARIEQHPNRRYFILKSIMISNLYGVDIMAEAVEIAKLRLFLKLVAQVEQAGQIEPLPDIDFNIRTGNTLVGFATREEVRRALTMTHAGQAKMVFGEDEAALAAIEEKAQDVDRLFALFRQQQTTLGGEVRPEDKATLQARLFELDDELNLLLARLYGVNPAVAKQYEQWTKSHQPLHWFVEFYGVLTRGGFDIVIGNPPYVELTALKTYATINYKCLSSGNLYALMIERGFVLCAPHGRQGYIVPVSSVSTTRYGTLQSLLLTRPLHYSSFDDRPSRLFDGLEHIRLAIHLIGSAYEDSQSFSTRYHKWSAYERTTLFQILTYSEVPDSTVVIAESMPKLTTRLEPSILGKLQRNRALATFFRSRTQYQVLYSRKVGYYLQVLNFEPEVLDGSGMRRPPSEFKELYFATRDQADVALCVLNSSLFYWYITVYSDCRHVNRREVSSMPVDLEQIANSPQMAVFAGLALELMEKIKQTSEFRQMRFAHDTLTIQFIYPKFARTIINRIDAALAHHYGFTDEELDFIINYDIKYRMGEELESDESDE